MTSAVRIEVPAFAREHVPASRYEVAFRLELSPSATDRSAEHWIRATFEDAPRGWRWFLIVGWTLLTCRLRPGRSPSRVLGWTIEENSPQVAVTAVHAMVGLTSRIVTSVESDSVTISSFVQFSGPTASIARVVWAMTTPLHEWVLPHLLAAAGRREPVSS